MQMLEIVWFEICEDKIDIAVIILRCQTSGADQVYEEKFLWFPTVILKQKVRVNWVILT